MKIDVGRIVIAHLRTLRDTGRSRVNRFDLVVFYVIPLAVGVFGAWLG